MPKQEVKNPNRLVTKHYTPISDYLQAKYFRENRIWTMFKGQLFTMVGGEYLTSKEFDERFPVPCTVHFNRNPDNPDTTHHYLTK